MGYYSFYRVIKDILQTIFGRKFFRLLLIILITIPIASFICSPVFAVDIEYNDKIYSYPDLEESYTFNSVTYYLSDYEHSMVSYWEGDDRMVFWFFNGSCSTYVYPNGNTGYYWDGAHLGIYYNTNTSGWYLYGYKDSAGPYGCPGSVVSSDVDIKDSDGNIVIEGSEGKPYFSNADDMLDYDFYNMYINMGNFGVDDVIYLHKLEVDRTFEEDTGVIYYKQSVFKLHSDSDYYGITNDLVSYYSIPRSALNLSSDKEYLFVLNDNASSINATNGLYTDDTAYDILHLEPNNSVVTPEKEQNDAIKGNTDAIKEQTNSINNLSNTITSNDYDESQIQIDGSLSENIDENSYTNFITEIINSINNAITCDWNTVETVEIPLGFVDESITWKSDLLSAHVPQSLKLIINTFWMFLFGFYIFKFSLSLVNWLKSGEILDGKGFNSDEVITSNML